MAYKVYITPDVCDGIQEVMDTSEDSSPEYDSEHLALAYVVNSFNNQEINSHHHWLYVVDTVSGDIII